MRIGWLVEAIARAPSLTIASLGASPLCFFSISFPFDLTYWDNHGVFNVDIVITTYSISAKAMSTIMPINIIEKKSKISTTLDSTKKTLAPGKMMLQMA
jgi:hypothetical protein